jgi:hypothetical protein
MGGNIRMDIEEISINAGNYNVSKGRHYSRNFTGDII